MVNHNEIKISNTLAVSIRSIKNEGKRKAKNVHRFFKLNFYTIKNGVSQISTFKGKPHLP